ncbi:MAG: EF-hand domain-containing protein [Candidatus Andeanibacterium colombiense]|uniref:EF-hand domain-containing protein n=1 Tax=Candidatus Andeanibacterium colombiense TaxID=3121345 RepID=A0AAJ5X672_9SPHN|nr:MAG: EF-hand domain-containing protein [Sphingomonadaceae bacterium]
MRKKIPLTLALCAATLGGAAAAHAAPDAGPQRGGPVSRAESLARADRMFDMLDTDRDGTLSPAELAAAASRGPGGPPPAGFRGSGPGGGPDMLAKADSNKDGALSRAEFEASTLARFDATDANHDGTVTPDERRAAMEERRAERAAGE